DGVVRRLWRRGRAQGRRRGVAPAPSERLPGLGVVGREAENLLPRLALLACATRLAVQPRHLLVDRDRLLGVADLLERPRQKRERLDRGGIGLEGRLQPRQGAARLTLVQVDASGLASDLRIGVLAGEEPLRHADVVVAAAFLFQLLQGAPKLLLAFVRLPRTEKELAEPSP